MSSWSWRESLKHSGLAGNHAEAVIPASHFLTTSNAVEPASTTTRLENLTYRRSLDPARFDHYHPRLGPLLGEEARLKAGLDCGNPAALHSLLPDKPYYNYYRWRRSLDPVRFDHFHPRLGPLLAEDERVRNLIANCPATQILVPPGGTTGGGTTTTPTTNPPAGGTSGGGIVAPAVPEPPAVVLTLVGVGVFASVSFARRWRASVARG